MITDKSPGSGREGGMMGMSPKCQAFIDALAQLCREHAVTLSTSGHDGIQVWDADAALGPLYVNGIEDKTTDQPPPRPAP